MFNFKVIVKIMGLLLVAEATAMIVALLVAIGYGGPGINSFLYSIGITVISGGILFLFGRKSSNNIAKRDGYIIVTLTGIVFSLFGSLP
ncbi:hypothetical protein SD074_01260 [Prolixibacter sp. SD074]|nr:hypothetical protein SD074_01260 [Prolixibacter sp. SD074]